MTYVMIKLGKYTLYNMQSFKYINGNILWIAD